MGPQRTLLAQALEEEADLGAVLEKRGSPADAGGGGTWGRGPAADRCLARLPEPCGPRDLRPLCLSAVSATFWVKKWWWKGDLERLQKQKAGGRRGGQGKDGASSCQGTQEKCQVSGLARDRRAGLRVELRRQMCHLLRMQMWEQPRLAPPSPCPERDTDWDKLGQNPVL